MNSSLRSGVIVAGALLVAGCFGSSGDVAEPDVPPITDPFADTGRTMTVLPPGQGGTIGVHNLSLEPSETLLDLEDLIAVHELEGAEPGPELESKLQAFDLASDIDFLDDQVDMYWSMTRAPQGLSDVALSQYFKDAPMVAPDGVSWRDEVELSEGDVEVTVRREPDHNIPHIYGEDRDSAFFGLGYATAQDRLFMIDVLRRAGRGELSKFMGRADFSFDRDINQVAPYLEEERVDQFMRLGDRFGAVGDRMIADGQAFIDGVNHYVQQVRSGEIDVPLEYVGLNVPLEEFVDADVVAIATMIQAQLGAGGGSEDRNARLIRELEALYNDADVACDIYHDLRNVNTPGASVTSTASFPTQSPNTLDDTACPLNAGFESTYPGTVIPDRNSFESWAAFETERCGGGTGITCPEAGARLLDIPNIEVLTLVGSLIDYIDPEEAQTLIDLLGVGGLAAQTPDEFVAQPLMLAEGEAQPDLAEVIKVRLREEAIKRVHGTLAAIRGLDESFQASASNALLVNAEHTATQNPIAVFGPQVDYFVPQLLMEAAMYVPDENIAVRGVTFPGLPYIVMGRGVDFAWSATSSGVDITDIRVLELCSDPRVSTPGSYQFNGDCVEFDRIEETWRAPWNLAILGDDDGQDNIARRDVIRSPHYGPVIGFAEVDGAPVALARQRSTYHREVDATPPFALAAGNNIHDVDSFFESFGLMASAFNWFYIDADDVAFISASLYPRRPDTYYPDFPSWGNGQHDWEEDFLPLARMPKDVNPDHGYIANWNNQPVADWWPADGQLWSSVDRNNILEVRLEELVADGSVTVAQVVEAMSDAAYVDLRAQELVPLALDIIGDADTQAQQDALDLLAEWAVERPLATRAQRRDRNGDGEYDDTAAVALMDAWYEVMVPEILPQVIEVEFDDSGRRLTPTGRDNAPGSRGSAYNSGWYGYMGQAFNVALGEDDGSLRRIRCADSELAADCRDALLSSLDQAISDLGGIGQMGSWQADKAGDEVTLEALGLIPLDNQHWINRPTFQQVIQFNSRR